LQKYHKIVAFSDEQRAQPAALQKRDHVSEQLFNQQIVKVKKVARWFWLLWPPKVMKYLLLWKRTSLYFRIYGREAAT
jgi:hypothetical protein